MIKTGLKYWAYLLAGVTLVGCSSSGEHKNEYDQPNARFTLLPSQLPDYEKDINHKGLILALGDRYDESLRSGGHIYKNLCATCHGSPEEAGSIPTAFRFWEDTFKVGNDPYAIYQTITKGYASMPPQLHLTPIEKYDVINYIREKFVLEKNEDQYFKTDSSYLASLPAGTSMGPAPKDFKPWTEMDYGNFLINTYELVGLNAEPRERSRGRAPLPDENLVDANFAYKGIAVRVDEGPGGVAAGKAWMMFDHDVLRVAGAWTGKDGFMDWEGILLNGRHNISPRTAGDLHFENAVGPGWASPETGSFEDVRFIARDKRRFGPLPRKWAHYKGLYQYKDRVIISYTVGNANVLEVFGLEETDSQPVFTRTINISSSDRPLKMRVAPVGTSVALVGEGVELKRSDGFIVMEVPASKAINIKLLLAKPRVDLNGYAKTSAAPEALVGFTKGGPARYPQKLNTIITKGEQSGPFQVDILQLPYHSPWKNQLRLSGIDFLKNKAVVCSTDGDVWLLAGLTERNLSWQRIASGLFQPLGIKVINGGIYVTCRDQIVRLHDFNGDLETDFYESFNSDHQVTDHFHEFAMGLQADTEGNLYYAKSGRHAREALVPQHGTLLKVSKDGFATEIIATGFRAANGVCLNPDGTFIVTDQEGHWTPMNRINWVEKGGGFYGNMFGYNPPADSSDSGMEQPLVWVERKLDQSPSELLWVESGRWGPLNGSLLSFSYGYGKVFIVPHEKTDGQMQGGIFELPIPRFSTGVMRGRFNPLDEQLYVCGLSAWGSTQPQLGGLYRVRYTGEPAVIPVSLQVRGSGMEIGFSDTLDPVTATDTASYKIETWDLKRSRRYGSRHYNVKVLKVAKATLSNHGKNVMLTIPDIQPTWVMVISYKLNKKGGEEVKGVIQNTIHQLGRDKPI